MPVIRLLGPPEVERDGTVVAPPRGHKSWAVLAYLALAEHPVPRSRLAALIFPDADDPLGALRWTLAQLRRTLGVERALQGDPLALPDTCSVDAVALAAGKADPALARGELLEGVEPAAGPDFDAWLLVERRRCSGLAEAALRDAALSALAAGEALEAAALAARVVALSRFDDGAHELLVRCLARAGDVAAAHAHAQACEALFRAELGRAPDPAVQRAASAEVEPPPSGDRAAAEGQLAAGRAAVDAGAVEPGLACLRHACTEARGVGDPQLLARVLVALGDALVHSVRDGDGEGTAALHEAFALAESIGDRRVAGKAARELGFVAAQACRGASASTWLARAGALAADDRERAAVLGVRGRVLSDRAHYGAALDLLGQSLAAARRSGDGRQAAWTLAIIGRAQMLRGELEEGVRALDESLELTEAEGWTAFRPLPEALRAEAALQEGDGERAAALLERAFGLGCRLGDPCWEALSARARGLAYAAEGDRDAALAWLSDATARSVRTTDPYVWAHAHCLDALAGVAIEAGVPEAQSHVSELERVAARADLRELVVRAALHRARLGDGDGLGAARLLGEAIDNPALHAELAAV